MPRKAAEKAPVILVNNLTGEIYDLPNPKEAEAKLHQENIAENFARSRWHDSISERGKRMLKGIAMVGLLGTCALIGAYGSKLSERHITDAALAASMRTSIPVINAMEATMDPGKYRGQLVDVVMIPTRGGIFKSGKGLYITEYDGSVALTIFESAFGQFQEAWDLKAAGDIAPHLIGKIIKARGTIQTMIGKDGNQRVSMVVNAPGLIQVLPERPDKR